METDNSISVDVTARHGSMYLAINESMAMDCRIRDNDNSFVLQHSSIGFM